LFEKLESVALFLSPEEAVTVLLELVSRTPGFDISNLVNALKKNISTSDISGSLAVRAIASLCRIGSLTRYDRHLLFKRGLDRVSDRYISILAMSLYCMSGRGELDPKFVRAICEKNLRNLITKDVSMDVSVRAGYALMGLVGSEAVSSEQLKIWITSLDLANVSFETRNQLVEMILASSYDVEASELISIHVKDEKERLLKDPVVAQVMEILDLENFFDMKDMQCSLPVLAGGNGVFEGVVFDVDSYSNPCSRKIRGKIAEKFGVNYKVVDPISWFAATDKSLYLDSLARDEQAVDQVDRPEAKKTPFFGYIRKIDLK
jgi:hypothetical protein